MQLASMLFASQCRNHASIVTFFSFTAEVMWLARPRFTAISRGGLLSRPSPVCSISITDSLPNTHSQLQLKILSGCTIGLLIVAIVGELPSLAIHQAADLRLERCASFVIWAHICQVLWWPCRRGPIWRSVV